MTALEVDEPYAAHGTRRSYANGCKCPECRRAEAAYRAERRRSPRGYVPAGKVRAHLAELLESGLSCREIARISGVGSRTVQRLANGDAVACSPANRSRLLGVLPARATNDTSVIPAEEQPVEPTFDDPLAGLRLILTEPDQFAWKAEAECARLDLDVVRRQQWFFPMRGESTAPALSICSRCPTWAACLDFALSEGCEGVWGRSCGSHRRKLVHHAISVEELAEAGMADDPDLSIADAIALVLAEREAVA